MHNKNVERVQVLRYRTPAIIALLLIIFLAAPLSKSHADTNPWDKDHLKSASELDYPPFAIVHPDGTAGGFSVDLLEAAAHAAGLSVSFTVGPWMQIKDKLAKGELDVLPLVSYSEERDRIYDFTAPYLRMKGAVFVRKKHDTIASLYDLKDKEILVMQGDTAHEYAMRHKLSNHIITTPSYEEAFKLLAAGNHDAVVAQQIVGLEIIKKLGLVNIVALKKREESSLKPVVMKLDGFEQKFCFAVAEGNHHLQSILNEGLAALYLNGTYNHLYEKWFTPLLPEPEVPLGELIQQILVILIPLLLVVTLTGLWYLKRQVALRTQYLEKEIRQRRLMEKELADANARYIKSQELGRVGSWEYDIAGEKLWMSAEAKRIFGFTADVASLTIDEVESCIPEKERVHKAFINLIDNNVLYNLEYDIIAKKSGERKTVNSLAELGRDEAGNSVKVQGVVADITERTQTENALRKSEDRFRRAVAGSPIPIMIHDEEDSVLQLSIGWTKLSGYALEDIPTFSDWIEKAYGERNGIQKTYNDDLFNINHSVNTGEWEIKAKDGSTRIWEFQTTPLGKNNTGSRLLLNMAVDITERKVIEESLRETVEMLRALLDGLPDIVMRFDRDCRHIYVSENVFDLVNIKASQFIGKTHRQLGFPEEKCIFWEESIRKVIDENIPLELEYSFEGSEGLVINNWRLTPEHDALGRVESVLSINRDITAQRKAEKNYQLLFQEMLEGFALHEIICNEEGAPVDYRFLTVNPSFERITGLDAEKLIGKTVLEVLPGVEKYWIDIYGKVALTGQPAHFVNYAAELEKFFETTVFRPVPGQFACILTDVTERKIAEKEHAKLQSQLQQAQKMEAIGTLAGGIAHDFNNILGAMIGYAEMVREDSPEGSLAANDLDQVLAAGNRAKALVKQILAFSRQTESSRIPLNPTILVKEAIKLLRSSIPSTIAIEQDLDRDCSLIFADPTQIHQIIMNLCTNAFHSMEQNGGILRISLQNRTFTREGLSGEPEIHPGDFVELSIGDSGAGISPEIMDRIFDPYFTTKETGKGTGMGLAIIHGIVMSYGGFIRFTSEMGKGTTFTINLPAWEEQTIPETPDDEPIPQGTEHILFVDDELMLTQIGKTILERLGYSVTICSSSIEALNIFKNNADSYDLVITDQTMPELTGLDLAEKILAIRQNLPIILCTGYSSTISEEKILSVGIKGFALKPLVKKEIAKLIRKILDKG